MSKSMIVSFDISENNCPSKYIHVINKHQHKSAIILNPVLTSNNLQVLLRTVNYNYNH